MHFLDLVRERWWRGAGGAALAGLLLALLPAAAQTSGAGAADFSFITAGDMRHFVGPAPAGKRYFDGLCEAARGVGAGAFMISPGDVDPPGPVRATIDRYLGTNYLWYPALGNHEIGRKSNMAWFHHWAEAGIPHLVQRGPHGSEDTTYSFDYGNSHFVVLNDYYDGRSDAVRQDDVPTKEFAWLKADLAATGKPLRWVIAHAPLKSLPDMDTGRRRHANEFGQAKQADVARFVALLKQYHVRAYICGHTHDCSVQRVEGVWQADSGHARGGGDRGSPSTFLKFRVQGTQVWVDIYRADKNGEHYHLRKTVELD